jgi:hypothetical protein
MDKSTISTGPFSIAMLVYQRVNGGFSIAMFDYRKVTFKNTKECNPE